MGRWSDDDHRSGRMVWAGLMFVAISCWFLAYDGIYLPQHEPALVSGIVVDEEGSGRSRHGTVQFVTADGQPILVGGDDGGAVGDAVSVRYDPDSPKEAAVVPTTFDWVVMNGLGVIGLILACWGLQREQANSKTRRAARG